MACLERREDDTCSVVSEMITTIEGLNEKIDDLENIVTVVTRLLLNKNVYQVEDIVDEYEKLKEEKAEDKQLNKINLEGNIEVDYGVQRKKDR